MILLNLDRKIKVPIFKQILRQLQDMIERNILHPGYRMPSSRALAEKLAVHRSTVYKAYEELWALGYLESRPGSYSIIRKKQGLATIEQKSEKGAIPWENISSYAGNEAYQEFLNLKPKLENKDSSDVINMAKLDLDSRLFPVEDFRRCMNKVLIEKGKDILRYGECEGYKPLRKIIAKRLQIHGISVSYEEILITNGAQNGFELILRLLTESGSKVVVESPTYSYILPLLNYCKTEVIGIPMTDTGIDLNYLLNVLKIHKPSFVYTIPNFHNPTGLTTNQAHREKLLSLCEKYKIPLVEDAFEEEMKYFGKVPLPIKSMDKHQIVIYLGTFSKVLFPGIRIGWIAAEKECIIRLAAIKRFCDLSSNSPLQAALFEFCKGGYYDLHVKRMHRIYRKRMQKAHNVLKKYMPFRKVSWNESSGGYLIWLKLEGVNKDEEELNKIFFQNRVVVSPGNHFFPKNRKAPATQFSKLLPGIEKKLGSIYFRISISTLNEEEIEEGIQRLRNAFLQIYQK